MKINNPTKVESYDTVYSGVEKVQKSTNTWWLKQMILIIFLFGFSAVDGFTAYPVFEYVFSSAPAVLYVTTVGTAIAINFLPSIAARCYLNSKYGLQEKNYMMFYVTMGLFSVIFIALAALRFATADEVIGNISGYVSSSSGAVADDSRVPGAIPMVILQIATNLITSAIAFFLSYLSENPIKMQLDAVKLQLADVGEYIISLMCTKKELEMFNYEKMVESEGKKCNLAHETLDARGKKLKLEADKQLEMLLHSADANTHITDAHKAEEAALTGQSSDQGRVFVKDETNSNCFTTKEVA